MTSPLLLLLVYAADAALPERASMLCFTVVRPGDQAKLLAQQFYEGVGIFACDEHMIFSSDPAEELFKPQQWGMKQWPIAGPRVYLVPPWSLEPGVETMEKVWRQILKLGYEDYTWTLQLDPQVSFLAPRVRDLLASHGTSKDGDAVLVSRDGKISSRMQALSKTAVDGLKQCHEVAASPEGYLKKCLGHAKLVQEVGLLADFSSASVAKVCNSSTGGFYPFPHWGQYMSCLGQAGYSLIPDSPNNLAKVSWTRDVLLGGGYLRPTMYCWALVQHAGKEPKLMRWQRKRGLGIFSCDGWMVVSNASAREVLKGQAWHTHISVVDEPTTVAKSFVSQNGKLIPVRPNAGIFAKAWQAVFAKGDYRKYDWTLKIDADVAVVPERLREVLHSHCEPGQCGKNLLQTFGGDLEGPVEAFSKDAAASLASGLAACSVPSNLVQPENEWLSKCASRVGVEGQRAPLMLSNFHQETPRPCDTMHASFHPFPSAKDMEWCLKQSGYYYVHAPATTTQTSTTTKTLTSTTTHTHTSSTATTTTWTTTVAKLALESIFHDIEGRDVQKQLPVWVITAENEHRGIPFAIALASGFLLLTSLSCCLCRPRAAQPPTSPVARAREDMEELLRP